jgi:hypothetical protein
MPSGFGRGLLSRRILQIVFLYFFSLDHPMQLGDDNNLFLKEFKEAISPNLRVTIHVRIYSMEDHAGYN